METLLEKAQRLGLQPKNQPVAPVEPTSTVATTTEETLLQKAQRLGIQPKKPTESFGQQITSAAKSGIEQIKAGYKQSTSSANPLVKIEGAVTGLAGAVNTVLSPLAPIFKPVGDVITEVGEGIGNVKAVQKFTNSSAGKFAERVAEDTANLMTVAGTVTGGIKAPELKLPTAKVPLANVKAPVKTPPVSPIVSKKVLELNKLESQYSDLRKASQFSKDNNLATKQRIASTDVLANVVDENGVIRTTQPGGAVDQYTAMTLDNAENVVRNILKKEDSKTNIGEIQIRLENAIKSNFAPGEDLQLALNKAKREIASYKKFADSNGDISNVLLQDRKIQAKANYNTPPEVQTYIKTLKSALQKSIEENSLYNIKRVNSELAKYLKDIEYLRMLDGKRVKGGKVGKYTAQISGNIVGGAVGGAVGGFPGSAIGTIVGGEISNLLKQRGMQGVFKGAGTDLKQSPIIKQAIFDSKKIKK